MHPALSSSRPPMIPGHRVPGQARAAPASLAELRCLEFETMRRAFHKTGGLACGDDIADRLRRRSIDQPISCLARWVVARTVVSFEWQSQLLLPVFQFDPCSMALHDTVSQVNAELKACLDAWELTAWFARESPWLDGRAPADCIRSDAAAVLAAARTDRFIMRG